MEALPIRNTHLFLMRLLVTGFNIFSFHLIFSGGKVNKKAGGKNTQKDTLF
jgi:hypothetical protein